VNEDAPWLSQEELLVWVHLAGLIMGLPPVIDSQLKRDSCLNFFEYSILVALANEPDRSLQMSTLAQQSNGSQSRLSHAVSRMEKAGWVTRRNCPEHSRGVEAVMTEAGWAKLVEAAPGHVREVRRTVIDLLEPDEMAALSNACRKIFQATLPGVLVSIDESIKRAERRSSP
jgi:DNA-binding MarR family transcriptional regulator